MGPFVFVPPLTISKNTLGKSVKPITNPQLVPNQPQPSVWGPRCAVGLTVKTGWLTAFPTHSESHLGPPFNAGELHFTPGSLSRTDTFFSLPLQL